MIKTDEDALVCDLAETYQIYDYRRLPVTRVAVFSYGLRDDSRIKMKMNEQVASYEQQVLADIRDRVALLLWSKTKDAQKGKNQPALLSQKLTSSTKNVKDFSSFESGKDFEEARRKLVQKVRKEGNENGN